jgi:hypothetical protein
MFKVLYRCNRTFERHTNSPLADPTRLCLTKHTPSCAQFLTGLDEVEEIPPERCPSRTMRSGLAVKLRRLAIRAAKFEPKADCATWTVSEIHCYGISVVEKPWGQFHKKSRNHDVWTPRRCIQESLSHFV